MVAVRIIQLIVWWCAAPAAVQAIIGHSSRFLGVESPAIPRINGSRKVESVTGVLSSSAPIWDRKSVLGTDSEHSCQFKRSSFSSSVVFCIRSYPDIVSSEIANSGNWRDCNAIAKLWSSPHPDVNPQDEDIFMDVGSNIGACLVQVLAEAQHTRAIAMEPAKANLFYLTQTLLKNPHISARADVLPIALGSEIVELPMETTPGNAGHDLIDPISNNNKGSQVPVKPLDDVMMPPYPPIRLMKIDVEGYESHVLRGAKKLLASRAVHSIYFEMNDDFLRAEGSSSLELLTFILNHNYVIIDIDSMSPVRNEELQQFACNRGTIYNLYAVLAQNGTRLYPQRLARCQ